MDLNEAREVRKKLKLSGALYGKAVYEAARAAYFFGDPKATWPDEMPVFIDGREDKTKSWTRI